MARRLELGGLEGPLQLKVILQFYVKKECRTLKICIVLPE